jgi:murein DD-endopeptidase
VVIKWDILFQNEQRQFEKMSEAEKYNYSLLLQYGSPYMWGAENPEGVDCSGSVCLALFMATGLLVRTTADDLYKRFFTVKEPAAGTIRAAFFIDGKSGTATHIAGLVGEGVALNAQEPGARVKTVKELSDWFWQRGSSMAIRGLDRRTFEQLAESNQFGLDKQLSFYF